METLTLDGLWWFHGYTRVSNQNLCTLNMWHSFYVHYIKIKLFFKKQVGGGLVPSYVSGTVSAKPTDSTQCPSPQHSAGHRAQQMLLNLKWINKYCPVWLTGPRETLIALGWLIWSTLTTSAEPWAENTSAHNLWLPPSWQGERWSGPRIEARSETSWEKAWTQKEVRVLAGPRQVLRKLKT